MGRLFLNEEQAVVSVGSASMAANNQTVRKG